MARKTKKEQNMPKSQGLPDNVEILSAGEVLENPITDTLRENYMPYAMSVIVSRALPEIDGLKPSHRKLLYTMYDMGLLKGAKTKSANIVGQTMRLNPHGDQAIYETMVRLARGNESLLVPFVDSKGNFGKAYSRDMAYAASRYTEAKLDPICEEMFRDIDSDTVDFVDNYDSTRKEPTLLPTTFPNILTNNTLGIAVGMASSICSFNLEEVCRTTIALIKDKNHNIKDTLLAPDFAGGGIVLYEIQQSSDVTYRFYDWDRTDSQGRKRPLHIEQALAVTDINCRPEPIAAGHVPVARVLDTPYFTLDMLYVRSTVTLPADRDVRILTILSGTLRLCMPGREMMIHPGDTLLLPAHAPELTLAGEGCAALSGA